MHPWFRGVDWTDLARLKAVFVPQIENDTDTSYFEKKHVSAKVSGLHVPFPPSEEVYLVRRSTYLLRWVGCVCHSHIFCDGAHVCQRGWVACATSTP
eukprot:1033739-Pelagomonas_calceolata.AAC.2